MKLRRYCVTVMDHWTPTRLFWTLYGALKYRCRFGAEAHLFQWRDDDGWVERQ
jgi:hypothetical protein